MTCRLRVMRGDRVGLLGPNGAGKTTMIKLIVGTLEPDSGRVRRGTNLQVAYFDQLRDQLDPERTLAETVSPGSDWMQIGENRKHISSYLQEFLFDSRRANAPIRMLSGGERNRLLLARLFARPANMLVLDEPTNDLDIDSLELLETMLVDYTGTLLLVSHDRTFLDNVVTQTIASEGNGRWGEYVGGYSDWLRQRSLPRTAQRRRARAASHPRRAAAPSASSASRNSASSTRCPATSRSWKREQQELTTRSVRARLSPRGAEQMRRDRERATELATLIAARMERWEALEALASQHRREQVMKPGAPPNRPPSASGRKPRIAAARA